jgi:glycosyltransferase involved in cell wall biosynthesis
MTPRVSVVIATYNYARFVAGALESALGQTFRDLEVIVVDDGSTDDTTAVVRAFLADGRLRYVRADHRGQPQVKNAGVRLARAPLVAFLDADDLWMPTKLERQVGLFESDPGLGLVYARRLLIDEQGWPLEYEQPELYRGDVAGPLFARNFVCFSSAVARREVLEREGLFDEGLELAIDFDLWLRVARHYRFDYVDEPLVQYRVGHASLSRRQEERLRGVLRIMARFLDERGGRERVRPAVARRAFADMYCDLAVATAGRSRWLSLGWILRALAACPDYVPAWHGLLRWPVPESLRRAVRRALGRPPQWQVRRRLPVAASLQAPVPSLAGRRGC